MNPFTHKDAARRYAEARPYYHPVAIDLVRGYLKVERPLERVLDVACGTGQSCAALRCIARHVVGVDSSAAMLAEARAMLPDVQYIESAAERLPFVDEAFDLITVGSAFHWFDRTLFLREANRLLPVSGWLIIYDNSFQGGRMRGCAEFTTWFNTEYLVRFPSPPRHAAPLTEKDTGAAAFCFVMNQAYANDVTFTADGLVAYLTTQSNIIAAVEEGRCSVAGVREWLGEALEPFFSGDKHAFQFGGAIWYLQKASAAAS